MFDADLARLYQVATKALNQALTRNQERFQQSGRCETRESRDRMLIPQSRYGS